MNENIILNIDNFVTIKDNNVVIPVEIYNFIKFRFQLINLFNFDRVKTPFLYFWN